MDSRHAIFCYDTATAKRLIAAVSLENRFWSPPENFFFYRSSGESSTHANTWFPCRGISIGRLHGWLIKPQGFSESFDVDSAYPKAFLDFVETSFDNQTLKFSISDREKQRGENPSAAFLARFGNIDCLLYSYVIGGGFWESGGLFDSSDNDSRALRDYLEKNYSNEINQIRNNCPEVAKLQNPANTVKPECDYFNPNESDPTDLQNSLEAQAKIIQRTMTNRLRLAIPVPSVSESEHAAREEERKSRAEQRKAKESGRATIKREDVYEAIPETRKATESEREVTKSYTDDDTAVEVGFIIASLGMYAYLKNCVDRREDCLSTPTAIAKIALAVLLPPVAMIIGVFSLFCPIKKCDVTEHSIESSDRNRRFVS